MAKNNNVKLLDCTLRDGGYVNDWNFGHDTLINIFERLVSANIDYIEIGFLDQRRPFDINRSIMPDTDSVAKIYGKLDKKNTKIVGMIDFGTCDLSRIKPRSESFLDGIRLIFRKQFMHDAMKFCKELKAIGYDVFANIVATTNYNDEELIELTKLINEVKPYAVSIVDTYGLFYKEGLSHYFDILDTHLDKGIGIGYHSHNNFQLGFSNSMDLMMHHKSNDRMLILDGCVYGMGNGAGNAPTELLVMHLNDCYDAHYNVNQILEIIDSSLMDIWRKTPWGYSLKFFIAASNGCTSKYVIYLLEKQTLSVKSINEILQKIDKDKRQFFVKEHIEKLYLNYQAQQHDDCLDYQKMLEIFKSQSVLIIGPGSSVVSEKQKIQAYINTNKPIVISINFVPENFDVDYLFITNAKRYVRQASLLSHLKNVKIIATSNVTKSSGNFDFVLDYEKLIDRNGVFIDNSLLMLLKVMNKMSVKKVALAGFDGYSSDKQSNYYTSEMEYESARQKAEMINKEVNATLQTLKTSINIEFITSTLYTL